MVSLQLHTDNNLVSLWRPTWFYYTSSDFVFTYALEYSYSFTVKQSIATCYSTKTGNHLDSNTTTDMYISNLMIDQHNTFSFICSLVVLNSYTVYFMSLFRFLTCPVWHLQLVNSPFFNFQVRNCHCEIYISNLMID